MEDKVKKSIESLNKSLSIIKTVIDAHTGNYNDHKVIQEAWSEIVNYLNTQQTELNKIQNTEPKKVKGEKVK